MAEDAHKVSASYPYCPVNAFAFAGDLNCLGCAGEDQQSLRPVLDELNSNGIGAVLDYSAEDAGDDNVQPSRKPPRSSVVRITLLQGAVLFGRSVCSGTLSAFLPDFL